MAAVAPLSKSDPKRILGISVIDIPAVAPGKSYEDLLVQEIKLAPGNVVVNTSMGSCPPPTTAPGACSDAFSRKGALRWLEKLRGPKDVRFQGPLEVKFLHFTTAGNQAGAVAQWNSPFSAAALRSDLTNSGGLSVAPLINTIVVESVDPTLGAMGTPEPGCLTKDTSNSTAAAAGYAVSAFGNGNYVSGGRTGVLVANDGGSGSTASAGTSFASPQAASLAVYLWGVRPSLNFAQLRNRVVNGARTTKSSCTPVPRPTIDAYATLLAADAQSAVTGSGPLTDAPVRLAILDFVNEKGEASPDGKFSEADLAEWVSRLSSSVSTLPLDFGRFDLNGDGYSGGVTLAPFDLDASSTGSAASPYSSALPATIAGVPIKIDENAVSDQMALCYYAYSNLYKATNTSWDERGLILAPIAGKCGLVLSSVKISFPSVPAAYAGGNPAELNTFTALSKWPTSWSGVGTCGAEQGGPVFSSAVEAGATFFSAVGSSNAPIASGRVVNRRPCSSFVAVKGRKLWLNSTARSYRITTSCDSFFPFLCNTFESDREYQSRLYLGDPATDRADRFVRYGDVNILTSGNFGQLAEVKTFDPSVVSFVYAASL